MSTGGRRQFDTNAIIERYDTRMAMTVLADFIFLGHQSVGSFALSSDKTELFSMAIGAYLDIIICEVLITRQSPSDQPERRPLQRHYRIIREWSTETLRTRTLRNWPTT